MPKVKINKPIEVTAKVLKIHMKVRDEFCANLEDGDGNLLCEQEDDYVPGFMPDGGGDYLVLDIDIDTGKVLNWEVPSASELQEWIDKCNGGNDGD